MMEAGFVICEEVFSSDECDRLVASIAGASLPGRAGTRNLMSCEAIREVAEDSRIKRVIELETGKQLTPFKAILFEKTSKANWLVSWHQDTALPVQRSDLPDGWGATSIKAGVVFAQAPASALSRVLAVRIHLDASTATNGPLRVLPGSHRLGVLNSAEIDQVAATTESHSCLVGKGGILAMSPLLLHASSKIESDAPRRVLHIEYSESLEFERGVRLAIA